MDKKGMFSAFDMTAIEAHQTKYAAEVKEKYGNTAAYKESKKKAAQYSKADWAAIMEKGETIYKALAGLMAKSPADDEVQAWIGKWRQHITDSFYDCTLEIFRGLGSLYVDDARFTANIDKYGTGLARFIKTAMDAYCDRQEKLER